MSITRTAARSAIRTMLAEPVARFFTDAEINQWIDDACHDISLKTLCKTIVCTPINTVSGCAEYTWPTTLNTSAVDTIAIKTIINSNDISLEYVSPNLIGRVAGETVGTQKWSEWGRTFIITPVPSAVYSLVLWIWIASSCTAASTIANLPAGYHHLIPTYGLYKGLLKRRDFAAAKEVWQQYLAEIAGTTGGFVAERYKIAPGPKDIKNQTTGD